MDQATLHFGKHKGRSLKWILANDSQYILWLLRVPRILNDPELWPIVRRMAIQLLETDECDLA